MIWTAQKQVEGEWVDQFHFQAENRPAAELHVPYRGFAKLPTWRLLSDTPEGHKAFEFLKRHNYELV